MLDCPEYQIDKFSFRALTSLGEVHEAQRLLYSCYVQERGWRIPDNTASEIKVVKDRSGTRITDKYSEYAVWFGAYSGLDLVGCFRVLPNKYLELPGYTEIPNALADEAIELNRLAISSAYRKHRIITLVLLRVAFDYAFSQSKKVYVTAEKKDLSVLFQKMGLKRYKYNSFKYHESDPQSVELLYYDIDEYDRHSTALYRLTSRFIAKPPSQALNS